MLVQINSDVKSFSESLSTLKFAERVSGVELGAAKSTKEGRDVRELMEQVFKTYFTFNHFLNTSNAFKNLWHLFFHSLYINCIYLMI